MNLLAEIVTPERVYAACIAGMVFCFVVICAMGVIVMLGEPSNDAT